MTTSSHDGAHRADRYPSRIVCLTEETTETLYLLEEDWRIVGISGFTVRPPRIRDLRPDLVLGFSDLQADIAAQLVRLGLNVCVFNQRDVAGILQMIRVLGGMVGCEAKADALATRLERGLDEVRATAARFEKRPRVYFEEWDEPMISGIRWVSELIGIAGGEDCFADNAQHALGKDRIIADPLEVVRRSPDIILGSWCGKKFRPDAVAARAGWESVPAVAQRQLHEIKSSIILQPGPAALTDGVRAIQKVLVEWQKSQAEA
jgi:iron complex transport system substrate-binding protein